MRSAKCDRRGEVPSYQEKITGSFFVRGEAGQPPPHSYVRLVGGACKGSPASLPHGNHLLGVKGGELCLNDESQRGPRLCAPLLSSDKSRLGRGPG